MWRVIDIIHHCTHTFCLCWYQDAPIVPMLIANVGTRIPRLYQYVLPLLVPGFPDCTNTCDNVWYQDPPIVPLLVNVGIEVLASRGVWGEWER